MRAMDAYEFAAGFPGLHRLRVDGADFECRLTSAMRRRRLPTCGPGAWPRAGARPVSAAGPPHQRRAPRVVPRRRPGHPPSPTTRCPACTRPPAGAPGPVEEQNLTRPSKPRPAPPWRADWAEALAAPNPDPATFADHEFAPPAVLRAETGERAPGRGRKSPCWW